MPTLTEDIDLPGGVEPTSVRANIQLWGDGAAITGYAASSSIAGRAPADGPTWTITDVVGNADITPPGTVYRVERTWAGLKVPLVDYISMPSTGGPYRVDQLLTDPPATVESSALSLHKHTLHVEHVTVPAAWGANRWHSARHDADIRQVKVHFLGDSIGQGAGATNPRSEGCVELIGDELRDRYGDGGTGWLPSALGTTTGTWTVGMGMGGCQLRATATATMQFTDLRGSSIKIFHRNNGKTGSDRYRWRVNGGGYTTVTLPTEFAQDPGAVSINPGGDGPHTLDIEWLQGTVDIFGVEATFPTGVVMYRFAQSGRAASDFIRGAEQKISGISGTSASVNITCASPGSFTNSMVGRYIDGPAQIPLGATVATVSSPTAATISTVATGNFSNQEVFLSTNGLAGVLGANMLADPFLAASGLIGRPDLVVLQLGANDPAGANNSADTYRAGMSKLLRLYSTGGDVTYVPDVVIVLEHIGTWFDIESEFSAMAAVASDLAGGNGAALVDIWGMGHRSWKYWNDLGYFADSIHPSTTGHQQYAAPVIDLLTA